MPGASEKEQSVAQKPDTVLVKAAVNGNAEGFTELCRRYYPAMVAIAHSVLGDRHLAEDAAQQAFAKVAVKLPQLKKESRFSMAAAKSGDDDTTEVVRQAISKLSASARELVFLRFYDGMSYEQISAVLGISEQAINGRLRRAKKKMAGYLRRNGFGEV